MAYKKIDKYLDSFYAGEISAKELVELDKKGEFSISDNFIEIFKSFDMRKVILEHKNQKNKLGKDYKEYKQIEPEDYKVFIDEGYINSQNIFDIFELQQVNKSYRYKFVNYLYNNDIHLNDEIFNDTKKVERMIDEAIKINKRLHKNQKLNSDGSRKRNINDAIYDSILNDNIDDEKRNAKLHPDPRAMIRYYLVANQDEIIDKFNYKIAMLDSEANRIIKSNDILNRTYSDEEKEKARILFECQKSAYLRGYSENIKDITFIKMQLGDLAKSPYLLAKLNLEGIITEKEIVKYFGINKNFRNIKYKLVIDALENEVSRIDPKYKEAKKEAVDEKSKFLNITGSRGYHLIAQYLQGNMKVTAGVLKNEFQDQYVKFLDKDDQKTDKRDFLEDIFIFLQNYNYIDNKEKMGILVSIYGGNKDISELQRELNISNFKYFFDKGYVDNTIEKDTHPKGKGTGTGIGGTGSSKINKSSYPALERYDELFALDTDVIFRYYDNSYIFEYLNLNKVAVEGIGKTIEGVINEDKTEHRTYLMNRQDFLQNEKTYVTEKDDRKVFNFNDFIPWFNKTRQNNMYPGMVYHNHTSGWINNIRKSLGLDLVDKKGEVEERKKRKEAEVAQNNQLTDLYDKMKMVALQRRIKSNKEKSADYIVHTNKAGDLLIELESKEDFMKKAAMASIIANSMKTSEEKKENDNKENKENSFEDIIRDEEK